MNENLYRGAGIPMATLRGDGTLVESNEAWARWFGTQLWLEQVAAEHAASTARSFKVAYERGGLVRIRLRDGRRCELELSREGEYAFAVATRRVSKAIDMMSNPEVATEAFFDKGGFLVWSADADATVVAFSSTTAIIDGFDTSGLVGRNALEALDDFPEVAGALVRALSGEETYVRWTVGPNTILETRFLPVKDPGAEDISGVVAFSAPRVAVRGHDAASALPSAPETPIIRVWDEVLCVPLIGNLDAERTSSILNGLLSSIVEQHARFAIVDLTGVDLVDTTTADSLVQLVRAARIVGAEALLCGMRPAVAQTIVALGLDLGSLQMFRTLSEALRSCMRSQKEHSDRTKLLSTWGKV